MLLRAAKSGAWAPARWTALLVALVLSFDAAAACADEHQARSLTPREILDRVDDLFRGSSSVGKAAMQIATEHWKRSLTLAFWTKGKERSLIRILEPKKEKGTATLKVGNELWNYLPKVNRIIKLPSSMMSASWMGSHFTNDDLVRESRMADDYDFEITFEGVRDGEQIVEITCIPKEDAPVVWGKVVVTVLRNRYLPLSLLYYDEDLALIRTMTYTGVRMLGGRELPAEMLIVPADKPGEFTRVHYQDLNFDLVNDDDLFSLRELQR